MGSRLTPEEAITLQDRMRRWWESPTGHQYGINFAQSILAGMWAERGRLVDQVATGEGEIRYNGAQIEFLERSWQNMDKGVLGEREAIAMANAPTYLVLDEMCDLVAHASTSMPQQKILATDLPNPTGFVWFNKPFYMLDQRDKRLNIAAISWHMVSMKMHDPNTNQISHEQDGLWLTLYTDTQDMADPINKIMSEENPQYQALMPRLSLMHGMPIWLSQQDNEHADLDEYMTDLMVPGTNTKVHPDGPTVNVLNMARAFWSLITQRLTHVETVSPGDRQAKRRVDRLGLERPSEIKVVNLRRAYEHRLKTGEPMPTNYSHRWLVNGHWRNQWYPSIKEHRQKWIDPYEKGPEDAELVVKDTVFRWSK